MATRKIKKFDIGGGVRPNLDAKIAERQAAHAAREIARGTMRAEREAEHEARIPDYMKYRQAVTDLYHPIRQARSQFAIGSPEAQNYRNYMNTLPDISDVKDLYGPFNSRGSTMPELPTLPAYNPNQTYARPERIDPKKIGMVDNSGGNPSMGGAGQGMKKGGKVSASKRGDGIAQRGKTRGTMR